MPSISMHELPPGASQVCNCNGPPQLLRIRNAARCWNCNGWLYPVAGGLSEAAAAIHHLELVGVLNPGETPAYLAGLQQYNVDPIRLCGFSRTLRPKRLRLGIEVELTSNADLVTARYGMNLGLARLSANYASLPKREASTYCLMKRDGSLPGHGVEYSCIPATIEDHKKVWQGFNWATFDRDRSRCGLHIHIDRRDISPLTIGKFHVFWNRISENDWVMVMLGRGPTSYCQRRATRFYPLPNQTPHCRRGGRRQFRSRDGSVAAKFSVVNHRPRTIEFRLPGGPADRGELLRALRLTEASVEYLKLTSMHELLHSDPSTLVRSFQDWCIVSQDSNHRRAVNA